MAWITGADVLAMAGAPDVTPLQAQNAADAACAFVETWLNRAVESTTYQEWVDRIGSRTVLVNNPPVRRIRFCSVDTLSAFTITNTQADANRAVASIQDGSMHLSIMGGVAAGDDALTLSTYATIALLIAAINALGNGWSAGLLAEGEPVNLRPQHLGPLASATAIPELPGDSAEINLIDADGGLLYIESAWFGANPAFVQYDGGFAAGAIPDDLTQITLNLAADILRNDSLGSMLESESLDKYSWKRMADVPDLRMAYKNLLQPWKRVVI